MKRIELTRGLFAVVDDADFEELDRYNWYPYNGKGTHYAQRNVRLPDGRKRTLKMHRFLTNAPAGFDVDHINGDGLDNRRENLRVVTRSQNLQNQTRKRPGLTSRFKGVSWCSREQRWRATISLRGKYISLGYFASEESAAAAYAAASVRIHGEFGRPVVEAAE